MPLLTTATDLAAWANRRQSQEDLPRLVRRLIRATVGRIGTLGFPSGDSIQTAGWDGVVRVDEGNDFVPAGTSVWELGGGRKVREKAESDYEKRTDSSRQVERRDVTFVFVTPRRWTGKEKWVEEKRADGKWRDVRAYDADDLEQWLEIAPTVDIWFSVLLGKRPQTAADFDRAWLDWAEATDPPLSSQLILAGRDEVAQSISKWLESSDSTLALKGETQDEALATFLAVVRQLPSDEREAIVSKAAVVFDAEGWNSLAVADSSLILVSALTAGLAITSATRNKHRAVIALGRSDASLSGTVQIPRVKRAEAEKALEEMGLPHDRARKLAPLARRSLPTLRRTLAIRPEVQVPTWASPEHGPALIPALLAGQWTDNDRHEDRSVLEQLASENYDSLTKTHVRWTSEADPPLRRIGEASYLISKQDAWSLLSRYLTGQSVARFETSAVRVLAARDPRYDLPPDKRWVAALYGKFSPHSELLREGLAETLACMGARGTSLHISSGATAADYATKIVRAILEVAASDPTIWASLSSVLPLLAEASPEAFLASVESSIGNPEFATAMFTDRKDADSFNTASAHPGLLWALETLAWSPAYLPTVALVLAKLAKVDPGGTLQNRPQNSLHRILLTWYPQTAATVEQRIGVLDLHRDRESRIAWNLLIGLLPSGRDIAFPTRKPVWHDWAPDGDPKVTYGDIYRVTDAVTDRLLRDVGTDSERWKDLLANFTNFAPERRTAIVELLNETLPRFEQDEDKVVIWSALREILSHHRSFPDAEWRLPDAELEKLDSLYTSLAPSDTGLRYGWLFKGWPDLPEGRAYKSEQDFDEADRHRRAAIAEVLDRDGLTGTINLATKVERPDFVGRALAQLSVDADEVLCYLGDPNDILNSVARGHVFAMPDQTWKEKILVELGPKWSGDQIGEFLSCWPSGAATWKVVEQFPDAAYRYWRNFLPYGVSESDREYVAKKLVEHGRPYAAVTVLSREARSGRDNVPPDVIMSCLEDAARFRGDTDRPEQLFTYSVTQLLDYLFALDDVDQNRVATIEWTYLPALKTRERRPAALHAELRRNPSFFVDLVSLAYRGKNEEPAELAEDDQVRARLAHDLLDSFRGVPGASEAVDDSALREWVDEARRLLEERGRSEIGDLMIGEFLSGSPLGSDGAWPHEAVRKVIEEIASDDLDRGITIGIYNGRGVVTKNPYEGGGQERTLASTYRGYAEAVRQRWPRTALMLDTIVRSYERDARREDSEADLREDLD